MECVAKMVQALDLRSRGLGFESRSAGHVKYFGQAFESTSSVAIQQKRVEGRMEN